MSSSFQHVHKKLQAYGAINTKKRKNNCKKMSGEISSAGSFARLLKSPHVLLIKVSLNVLKVCH